MSKKIESATKRQDLVSISTAASDMFAAAFEVSRLFADMLRKCASVYKGEPMPKADFEYIAETVRSNRGWTAESLRARKSELKTAFDNYASVSEAIKLAEKANGGRPLAYTACMQVSRAIKSGKTVAQAAKAPKQKSTKASDPATRNKADSIKSAKIHVNRILEHKALPAAFRMELKMLAAQYDII